MDFTFKGSDCDGKQRGEGSAELLDGRRERRPFKYNALPAAY